MVSESTHKDEILDAAEKLFERYGYGKTTVDEIAKEAGIGKGSIYLQFQSKEDLAFAWIDRIHRRLESQLKSILETENDFSLSLHKALVHRVLFRYDLFSCHERSMDEALEALRIKLLDRRDRFHEREAGLFARHLVSGAGAGAYREMDAARVGRSLVTATNALMPYSLRPQQIGDRDDVCERTTDLANLLVQAVTKESK